MVERNLAKVEVASSSLVSRSRLHDRAAPAIDARTPEFPNDFRHPALSSIHRRDQNGGKGILRLAVMHLPRRHHVETSAQPETPSTHRQHRQSPSAAGLTQRELAARLKRSNSFIWKLEAGERQVNVLEFIEIARTLGVKPSELIAEIEG